MMRVMLLSVLLASWASSALAGDLMIQVKNVSDSMGQILITVCKEAEFNRPRCNLAQTIPAMSPSVSFNFPNIAPGIYAIKAFHDRNSNGELDRGFLGFVPIEGYGFSRLQEKVRKPPEFADIAIPIGTSDTIYEMTLYYP